MKKSLTGLFLLFLAISCSTYKELAPDPELSSFEGGYIELKNDDEFFELEKDVKYFIKFPPTQNANFYLVLVLSDKNNIDYFLTDNFNGENNNLLKIPDIESSNDSLSVYELSSTALNYFWIVEKVNQDMMLKMKYRYTPIWRFKFENKYADYLNILENNIVNKNIFNSINTAYNTDQINFVQEISRVEVTLNTLKSMQSELGDLEKIFPSNIANTTDSAYQNYLKLKSDLQQEILFQENYFNVLDVLNKEKLSRTNPADFIKYSDKFLEFIKNTGRYPKPIIDKAKLLFSGRINDITSYLKSFLSNKRDIERIDFSPPVDVLKEVFQNSLTSIPQNFTETVNYINSFNTEVDALNRLENKKSEINDMFRIEGSWPSNDFYSSVLTVASEMKGLIPVSRASLLRGFNDLTCSQMLKNEIIKTGNSVNFLINGYNKAKLLVPQINVLAKSNEFRAIIKLLLANKDLNFFVNQYPDIDEKYLSYEKSKINSHLSAGNFSAAEQSISELYYSNDFLNPILIKSEKETVVRATEQNMFNSIKESSFKAVDAFVQENLSTYDNVETLYSNSVFTTPYTFTFSTGGQSEVNRKNGEIASYLDEMKHNRFPSEAIQGLYKDFVRNFNSRGVDKARAIVSHGKFYKGSDTKVKNMIDECDVNTPKWITQPKEYRNIFALPITSNKTGSNRYKFRVRLNIPSEAQFPVFDINIKLPSEIAKNASSQQWYDEMKINNTLIKNEGRIKITAPTSSNNYEFQVTPVSMDKGGRNILDVTFTYPAYRVFEISVMAQPPIIRKN